MIQQFNIADLARLHGCVMHEIESFDSEPSLDRRNLLLGQKYRLSGAMAGNDDNQGNLSLSTLLQCVENELAREVEARKAMTDGMMLSERYRYAGHLEALRAKIETMTKDRNEQN